MKTTEYYELQFDKFGLRVPKGCWYAGYDSWAKLDEGEVLVGITDFYQTKLGDLVFVDPADAEAFEQDDVFVTLESIKAAVDVTIPASGTVISFNPALQDKPELVNLDPYGEGWIARLRPTMWEDDKFMLLDAEAYFDLMQDKVARELDRA
ncbi:MAG: glycine cleavage system protein H [Anaerolineae bacterium]